MSQEKNNLEIRSFVGDAPRIEKREGQEQSRTIVGYAAKFELWSNPIYGWFKEKIARGAFDEVLDDDVVALFNHDRNHVLARNKVTLTLSVDEIGLRYEFEAPNNTTGNDLLESVERGDIKGSSFQFIAKKVSWETAPKDDPDGVEEYRTIEKIERLIDVSPVTFPAYPDADVMKRDRDSFYGERKDSSWELRSAEREREITILKLQK